MTAIYATQEHIDAALMPFLHMDLDHANCAGAMLLTGCGVLVQTRAPSKFEVNNDIQRWAVRWVSAGLLDLLPCSAITLQRTTPQVSCIACAAFMDSDVYRLHIAT